MKMDREEFLVKIGIVSDMPEIKGFSKEHPNIPNMETFTVDVDNKRVKIIFMSNRTFHKHPSYHSKSSIVLYMFNVNDKEAFRKLKEFHETIDYPINENSEHTHNNLTTIVKEREFYLIGVGEDNPTLDKEDYQKFTLENQISFNILPTTNIKENIKFFQSIISNLFS